MATPPFLPARRLQSEHDRPPSEMKFVPCSEEFRRAFILLCSFLLSPQLQADQLSTWSRQNSDATNDFFAIAYGAGTFVAAGFNGQLYSSADGTIWTPQSSGTTNDLEGVTYGNGLFVAVGENGSVRASTNGTIWRGYLSGFDSAFHAVTYANGLYVAVGFGGTIRTSAT